MLNPLRQNRVEGRLLVSAFDFDPAVVGSFTFPESVEIVDSTIRKSYFTAGATTSSDGFVRIGEALAGLGVR